MSIFKKLKDVLFEEEEYTEPIKIREDKREEVPIRPRQVEQVEKKEEKIVFKDEEEIPTSPKTNPSLGQASESRVTRAESERELFKKENTFEFPSFDEEEFQSSMRKNKPTTNVLEYERKKSVETRSDYGRYDKIVEKEYKEKKKFTPSPIISPVYGILNQDYKAEDIIDKTDKSILDFESVRKKAFEPKITKEEKKEEISIPKVCDIIDEPVVTFFEEKDNIKVEEEKTKDDYKTINDLLEEASDEVPLDDTLEIPVSNNLDVIEEELEKIDEHSEKEKTLEEDLEETKDNELFELIDSMYEEREEDN